MFNARATGLTALLCELRLGLGNQRLSGPSDRIARRRCAWVAQPRGSDPRPRCWICDPSVVSLKCL